MNMLATDRPAPLTAADVRACISAHFGAAGGRYAVLFEVRNGTAWSANRSVDAVVMSLWPSLGMELWGMEIKTARHDWRRELSMPAKASEVFDYFDRWFLVAPEEVAKLDELPSPWGWFVPDAAGLRKIRDAEKNPAPKAIDRHFLGALLRNVTRAASSPTEAAVNHALAEQRRKFESEVDKRALERVGDLRGDAEQWVKLRDLLRAKPDNWIHQPDVVEAVRLVLRCGVAKAYGGIRSLIDEVNRNKTNLDRIAADLKIGKRRRR
jgi:hypothetical protein